MPPVPQVLDSADRYFAHKERLAAGEGKQHFVAELLPAGFARYLRVLDPWSPEHRDEPRRLWRELAALAGVDFYSEISWLELRPVVRPDDVQPEDHLFAASDQSTMTHVLAALRAHSTGPYFFAYDLAASVILGREAAVIEYAELDLEAVMDVAALLADRPAPVVQPELWWPADESWFVSREYDIDELYIAGSHDLAELLLADENLEVVEVQLGSRIDWHLEGNRRPIPR